GVNRFTVNRVALVVPHVQGVTLCSPRGRRGIRPRTAITAFSIALLGANPNAVRTRTIRHPTLGGHLAVRNRYHLASFIADAVNVRALVDFILCHRLPLLTPRKSNSHFSYQLISLVVTVFIEVTFTRDKLINQLHSLGLQPFDLGLPLTNLALHAQKFIVGL